MRSERQLWGPYFRQELNFLLGGGTTLAMGEGQGLVWMLHLHGDLTSELNGWPETKPGWDRYRIIWVVPQ